MEGTQSQEEFLAERKIDFDALKQGAASADAEKQRIIGIIKTVRSTPNSLLYSNSVLITTHSKVKTCTI